MKIKGNKIDSEFLIPSVISSLIENKKEKVDIVTSNATWFGVTYKEDKNNVVNQINKLIDKGVYPHTLF